MSAVSKKIKSVNQKFPEIYKICTYIFSFASGFGSLRAAPSDVPVAFFIVTLLYCQRSLEKQLCLLAGFMVGFVLNAANAFENFGYLIAVILLFVIKYYIKKEKAALIISVAAMTAYSLFTNLLYAPWQYKALALVGGTVLIYFSVMAEYGAEILKGRKFSSSFSEYFCCVCFMAACAFPLSGLNSAFLMPGVMLSTACAWKSAESGNMAFSLTSLILCLALTDDIGLFARYFACFLIMWAAGCLAAEKGKFQLFASVALAALILNLIFLSDFLNFSLFLTVVGAILIYPFMPAIKPAGNLQTGKNLNISRRIENMADSIGYISDCITGIYRVQEKIFSYSAADNVAETICRKCPKNHICWFENYDFTYGEFLKKEKEPGGDFSRGFLARCTKTEGINRRFEKENQLRRIKKYASGRQKANRQMLRHTLGEISSSVAELSAQIATQRLADMDLTAKLDNLLNDVGILHSYCICGKEPEEVQFTAKDKPTKDAIAIIKSKIENMYGRKFQNPQIDKRPEGYTAVFTPVPKLKARWAVSERPLGPVSGDGGTVFINGTKLYAVLSDGMGTGNLAAGDSQTVLSLLQRLITGGIAPDRALDMANITFNLRRDGSCATGDITVIDLETGDCRMYKCGAVNTAVIRGGLVINYGDDSLPLGGSGKIKPYRRQTLLKRGDMVIMTTDGIKNLPGDIADFASESPDTISAHVCAAGEKNDDITALVIKIN